MEIIIQPDSGTASALAAKIVARIIKDNPDAVIGFPTGATPLEFYRNLVRMHREEGLDFSRTTTFNLDEFVGLPPDHSGSYHVYMDKHLFGQVNVGRDRIHIPDGLAADIPASCRRYEEEIRTAGGIDVQILGIGVDGHIGFNEPTSSLGSRTRIKTLTRQTRRENAAEFGGEDNVPYHVLTMGIGTILDSRLILLLAFGAKKAPIVAQTVEGPVTALIPASALQHHPRTILILDEEAAGELAKADYYRYVYEHKPDWQKY
ncbi:MAG: glucosamine-6-phosphate deaminase [Candidatus Aminicenantes bacterium]|nr:glucosamine-6-phosphate deaminase [Candidatus Aminicenantes bacterium]